MPRTLWRNVSGIYYDTINGVSSIIRWIPLIWHDRDWDWCYLASIMEFKLRRMSDHELKHGHHLTSEFDAKNQLICAHLLKRLRDDSYFEEAKKQFKDRRFAAKQSVAVQKQDQEMLGRILGKYLTHWWD